MAGHEFIDPSTVGTAAGLNAVRAAAERARAVAVGALSDSHLLWLTANRSQLEPSYKVLAPPHEVIERLQSKRFQIEAARASGLEVLPSWYFTSSGASSNVPPQAFPLALRPDAPGVADPPFKVHVVNDRIELATFLSGRLLSGIGVIGQPYRSLPNLLIHGARTQEGEPIQFSAFIVRRKFEGVSLSIEATPFPAGLEDACQRFAEQVSLTGCFHFEFLLGPDGQAYFLEVNARLGGTTDKAFRAGFDEPALLFRAFGLPVHSISPPRTGRRTVVNKRAVARHLLHALRGKSTETDYPPVGRLVHAALSVRDLLLARDSLFDWRDLQGSLSLHLRRP